MALPALIFAGIGAAASIASGISGSQAAASQNAQAQSNYKATQKAPKKQARNCL